MPKIIPDLGPRILRVAASHFETRGFAGTDMKSLAGELGISVGTLYNYYGSKPDLFLAVSQLWKDQLVQRMLACLDEDRPTPQKLHRVLSLLHEDMQAYTGLWKEFLGSGARLPTPIGPLDREYGGLRRRLQSLLVEVWSQRPHTAALVADPEGRLAEVVLGAILQQVFTGGPDPEGRRRFVQDWIAFVSGTDGTTAPGSSPPPDAPSHPDRG